MVLIHFKYHLIFKTGPIQDSSSVTGNVHLLMIECVCLSVCYHIYNTIIGDWGERIFVQCQWRVHSIKMKVLWEYLPTQMPDDSSSSRGVYQYTMQHSVPYYVMLVCFRHWNVSFRYNILINIFLLLSIF